VFMSTRWETLAGDTSRFAVKMSFIADSSEVPVVPDLAASWGSLELWVHGANLCAHVEEGETVEGRAGRSGVARPVAER